jgi:hypothetical protein
MQDGFGKTRGRSFIDFVTPDPTFIPPNRRFGRLLPETEQKPSLAGHAPQENVKETPKDQPLRSPAQRAVADAFHRMFELSRTEPAPPLAERLDRLSRLRHDPGERIRVRGGDRRDPAGARRNQARRQTFEEMDGAAAAGDRVMIKPSELVSRFSALLNQVIAAKFDAAEIFVTREASVAGMVSLPTSNKPDTRNSACLS